MKKTHIIAEIGINHNGSLKTALKLIDLASIAGCDSVKFQKRDPDVCVPEHQKPKPRNTPWGEMTYIEYKHRVEFQKPEYDKINSYCKSRNIQWSASPWDLNSLNFLSQYDIPYIKIASPMLTDDNLLMSACKTRKKIIASTGMSTLEEVDHAVNILREYSSEFAILHCNSSYPAKLEELNLSCIRNMKERYNCEVGYSGHEFRLGTSVSAVYLGATIIERHITLDRTMWGTDHLSSVEPQGLIKLVKGIRELEIAHGDGKKRLFESEKPFRDKLRKR
jgi:N-acetylneuraminate synthase